MTNPPMTGGMIRVRCNAWLLPPLATVLAALSMRLADPAVCLGAAATSNKETAR